jgi:hypothetical protein
VAIVRVTSGWMCGIDASAPLCTGPLQARILWAWTSRHDKPDEADRE